MCDGKPGLMGAYEVAQRLGVGRARVHQIANDDDTFPDPVRLHGALIWYTADVEAWVTEYRPGLVPAR